MVAQIKTKTKTKTRTNHLQNALVWPKARARQIDFTASLASTADSEMPKGSRGFLPTKKATTTTLDSYEAQDHCG
jgi:hypothetical protein